MAILALDKFFSGGILEDPAAQELSQAAFSSGINVRFTQNSVRSSGLYADIAKCSVDPFGLATLRDVQTGLQSWFYLGKTSAYRLNGSTHTNVSPSTLFTSSAFPTWTALDFGGVLTVNNGIDVPHWYDSVAEEFVPYDPVTDEWKATWVCDVLRPYKQFMIALALNDDDGDDNPWRLMWSEVTEPGTVPSWDYEGGDNLAGDHMLTETPGRIVDGLTLGDNFVVYKTDSAWMLTFTGGPLVMQIQRVHEHGLLASGCVIEHERRHFFASATDIMVSDGYSVESVIRDKNREKVFNEIDPDYFQNSFLVKQDLYGEFWFCYPERESKYPGYCTKAACYNYLNGQWSFRDIPPSAEGRSDVIGTENSKNWDDYTIETWGSEAGTVLSDRVLDELQRRVIFAAPRGMMTSPTGPPAGALIHADSDHSNLAVGDGDTYARELERLHLPIAGKDQAGTAVVQVSGVKFIRAMYPKIEVISGEDYRVTIEIGTQFNIGEKVTWHGPITILTDAPSIISQLKANFRVAGRYLSYRLRSTGPVIWRLTGLEFDVDTISKW